MKANLDIKVGILRAGPEFKKFGDPYVFSCTVLISGDECVIEGASGEFSRSMFTAIKEELKEYGICKINWERKKKTQKKVEIDI